MCETRNSSMNLNAFSGSFRVVDLTRLLRPGEERFKLSIETHMVDEYVPGFVKRLPDDWYIVQDVTLCSHVGTHIESPFHHIKEGYDCSEMPLEKVMGEAVVLDFSHKKDGERIEREEMEAVGSRVKPGDIVILRIEWSKYYGTDRYLRRPFLSYGAAEFLVERDVRCIGVDGSGIENNADVGQPVHKLIFSRGIPVIEDLDHLSELKSDRFFLIALPLKIKGLDASPARVIGLEFE